MNHLTNELVNLRELFIEMAELVRKQFEKSRSALINFDQDLAEEIIRFEARVNALELNIEKQSENIIALYQPVASDLRNVLAIMRAISDLERIGDHAEFVSKIILEREVPFEKSLFKQYSIEEMYAVIFEMYEKLITAFTSTNSEQARKVFKKDKELNKSYKKAVNLMKIELCKENPINADILNIYAIIARLERTGDLLTNVAEEIIFFVDAEILKHKKKL